MKVLILAGGFATRLRPLSCTRPKTLFPVLNKPLLEWTFERLAKNNFKDIILAVNRLTETYIKQQRIPKHGLHVTFSRDPPGKPLGTGGPIKRAESLIGNDTFMVVNGDIFADINYAEILKLHEESDAIATIALHTAENPSRYGVAELTEGNRIKRFIEKPPPGTAPTNLINAGVYVLNPKVFKYIPEGRMVSFEREVFPKLVDEGKLYGYVFNGLWIDIGEPEDYLKLNKTLLNHFSYKPKYKAEGNVEVKEPVAFDKNVSVGAESILGPYVVLGKNVTVGRKTRIQDSVVFPEATISDSVSINGALIGERVSIGNNVKIGKNCVIGDHVKIKDNVQLAEGVYVCPGKEVSESVLTSKCIF